MNKLRFFFSFILFFLLLVFVFDVSYLFSGVRATYLRGEVSAQIDDSRFFYNRVVLAKDPVIIPNGHDYSNLIKNSSLEHGLKKSKSVAFLVIQNDSVRCEKYWGLGKENSLTNSFSVAKSIVSLLVGCAIDGGFISSVEQSVFDFVPELKPFHDYDVKVKHLLEMSSGLNWLENYKKPISVTAKSYYGDDLKKLILERGFVSPPGTTHDYKSGDTQILGVLLERAVGKNISSFASEVLWSKIGAQSNALWSLDQEKGIEKTFCCFHSSARDFSKIGLLMLGRGSIFGKRVVDSQYIDWLIRVGDLNDVDSDETVDYYANGWWIAEVLEMPIFYARGFNGQYVVVVPELDLVFVRLGLKENENSVKNNDYKMSNDLKFFVEQVIKDYSL